MRAMFLQFVRFAAVGVLGFVVDGGLLYALVSADVNAYQARFISFPVAVVVTWYANRTWTFSSEGSSGATRQLGTYVGVQLVGATVNYGVYAAAISQIGTDKLVVLAAFAAGSAAGMFVNFFGAKLFVFRGRPSEGAEMRGGSDA